MSFWRREKPGERPRPEPPEQARPTPPPPTPPPSADDLLWIVKLPRYAHMAKLAEAQGMFAEADDTYQMLAGVLKRTRGETHPDFATATYQVGRLNLLHDFQHSPETQIHYNSLGRAFWIQTFCGNALEIRRAACGETHRDVAESLYGMGVFYGVNKPDEARQLLHRALAIQRTALRDDSLELAMTLHALGKLHYDTGEARAALPFCQEALEVHRRVSATRPRMDEAAALCAKAKALGASERDQADALFDQAVLLQRPLSDAYFEMTYRIYTEPPDSRIDMILELHRGVYIRESQAALVETLILLLTLAQAQMSLGNYSEAGPLLDEVGAALRASSGPHSLAEATALNNLGSMYRLMGKWAPMTEYAQRAVDVAREAVGERHPAYVTALGNLGASFRVTRRHAEAEPVLRRALELAESLEPPSPQSVSACRFSLGLLYSDTHKYEAARPLLEQYVDQSRARGGEDTFELAVALVALGKNRRVAGDYAAAARLLRQATDVYRKTVGEEHPNYAGSLSILARLYSAMGWHTKAEPLLLDAARLQVKSVGPHHPEYLATLNQLAIGYALQGKEYGKADFLLLTVAEDHRKVYGERSAQYAAALHNLAMLRHLVRRDRLRGAVFGIGERDRLAAIGLEGLADAYERDEHHAATETLLEQVVEIERQVLGERHPSYAESLLNLGKVCHEQGKYAAAGAHYRAALEIQRAIPGRSRAELARALNALADFCVATGRHAEAFELMREGNEIDGQVMGQVFSCGSESQRLEHAQTVLRNLYVFLSFVGGHLVDSSEAVTAALDLVLQRKAIGAEALGAQRDAVISGRYPHLAPQLQDLRLVKEQIWREELSGEAASADSHSRLLEWRAKMDQLDAKLAQQIPEMDLARQLRTVDHRAVMAALPSGAALIEFVRSWDFDFATAGNTWKPERYLAFVVNPGGQPQVTLLDLGDASSIDRMITDFRSWVVAEYADGRQPMIVSDQHAGIPGPGEQLHTHIIDPVLRALGGVRRVFLAPDGELAKLAFEALRDGAGVYFIDRCELSYVDVGRDILRFACLREGPAGTSLVVADPDFDLQLDDRPAADADHEIVRGEVRPLLGRDGLTFARLPGTRREGEQVAALLSSDIRLGAEALESTVKAAVSPQILHIATHGFFRPDRDADATEGRQRPDLQMGLGRLFSQPLENPLLRSGLALAGANGWGRAPFASEREDGILFAADVSALDLSATDMVVLSACETGLGDVKNGEGVIGLRRAFALAGARTLITSLWKVPDDQTQELMAEFYRRLRAGDSRIDALTQAKRSLRSRHPEVLSWASFVCHGDPGPVRFATSRSR